MLADAHELSAVLAADLGWLVQKPNHDQRSIIGDL
jgi:hypothetical protein